MSFSIKTILKLICLLGLFACTSKSASAQSTNTEFGDIVFRTNASTGGEGENENENVSNQGEAFIVQLEYQVGLLSVSVEGLYEEEIGQFYLVDLNGNQYSLLSNQSNSHEYQVSLAPGYYSVILNTPFELYTHNIYLQP